MKIAALTLATALAAIGGSAQPGFAQNANQNSDQSQYGQDQNRTQFDQTGSRMNQSQSNPNGSMNEENEDENAYTSGQNDENGSQQYGNSGNRNAENDTNGSDRGNNRGGWSHRNWRMEGRMGPQWHHRMMMGRNEGATFSFGNGNARMRIHCPTNESLQTCVNAATQLLDRIGRLKNQNAANLGGDNQTNGQGSSSMQSPSGTQGSANPDNAPDTGPGNAPNANEPAGSSGADQTNTNNQQQ